MKILLADDHPLIRMGVRRILEQGGGFEIVAEAKTGAEVLPLVEAHSPEVVLLDMRMPGIDGLGCLDRIRARYPDVKVIVLSVVSEPEQIQAAFKRGACGYIIKSIDPEDLASAIRQAIDGTAYHALGLPAVGREGIARAAGLTDRELTIMTAVARGLSNAAIGNDLWITEQTVKFHLTNVYRKLEITNRTEAARWVFARGLVEEATYGAS